MKTVNQIIERVQELNNQKMMFDFRPDAMAVFVPNNRLIDIGYQVNENVERTPPPLTREAVLEEIRTYMSFAWEKANDERGLSAVRSIQKFQAWLWLLEDEELLAFAEDDENYPMYGKPILRKICTTYGLEIEG